MGSVLELPRTRKLPFGEALRVYLAYLDDSESYDKRFQVVGGILVKDQSFGDLEECFGSVVEELVPESLRDSFEFHASDLFNSRQAFKDVKHETAVEILERCVEWIDLMNIPVFYGAVDLDSFQETIDGHAHPVGVGFSMCARSIEEYLAEKASGEMGLLIVDSTDKKDVRQAIQSAFRNHRRRVKEAIGNRGHLEHIHDDLYFGDSAYSYGLQAADVCAYFINRHLNGRKNTEHIYKKLERLIFHGSVVPA